MIKFKKLLGALSLMVPYFLLTGSGSGDVLFAIPAAAIAIPLITAGIGAFASSRGSKPPELETLLPQGLKFFGDPSLDLENKALFEGGLKQFLQSLSDPGLPPEVRQRALAQISSAFAKARGAGARQSALTGGVFNLSEPSRLFSVGTAAANTEADIAFKNKQLEAQRNQQLLSLMNFVRGVQGIPQAGRPSTTQSAISGGLAGAGAGFDFFGGLQKAGAFQPKTPPTIV